MAKGIVARHSTLVKWLDGVYKRGENLLGFGPLFETDNMRCSVDRLLFSRDREAVVSRGNFIRLGRKIKLVIKPEVNETGYSLLCEYYRNVWDDAFIYSIAQTGRETVSRYHLLNELRLVPDDFTVWYQSWVVYIYMRLMLPFQRVLQSMILLNSKKGIALNRQYSMLFRELNREIGPIADCLDYSYPKREVPYDVAYTFKRLQLTFTFDKKNAYNRSLWFWIYDSLFQLVVNILKENVLQKKYFSNLSFVFFLFLTILLFNIAGIFPFTFTITSSFVITLFLSLSVFLSANIMGIYHNGFAILSNFLPTGTPLFVAPLLILIEATSYFSRIFSLSIRLFANMLSGHGLLKVLIWFSYMALNSLDLWFPVGFLPWMVVTIVLLIEVAISFLQAYVFIILTAIYINDAINPH